MESNGILPSSEKDQTLEFPDSINSQSETVIFLNNPEELNFFKNLYESNILRTYENLMALRINLPLNIMKNQPGTNNLKMFGSDVFENFNLPRINRVEDIENGLQVSQVNEEANLLGINLLWNAGYNGTGVNIAIMDNGIDFTHPALSTRYFNDIDISTNNTTPCKDHGTPVAGVIAANLNNNNTDVQGMAFGSKIHDISFGCIGSTIEGDILAGFDYILENNATIDVVNTSFGGFAPSWDFIVEKLESEGIILVGSAGNDGPGFHTTTTGGPGNSIYGISVGASDRNGQLTLFSARGPASNMLFKPDVIAPGVNINSTSSLGGYSLNSGTSFSSPLVAGGISSLISALNSLGYNWNPGVIKAALLNTAENITNNELSEGQGIASFDKALDLISFANVDSNNVPEMIALTPNVGPINYLSEVPKGMIVNIPLSMISSHPNDVEISFTDDLTAVASNSSISDTYSQVLEIQIDTNSFQPGTIVSGNITATLNGTTAVTQLTIEIGEPMKGKIGIDLGHTYWDDLGANGIGASNTGEMVKLAMLKGYSVEHITEKINETILNDFDIFWMPDPLSLMETDSPSLLEQGFQQNILYDSEITAIVDFVNSGGSLLIDFNGLMNSSENLSEEVLMGLNATGINKLISNFNIEASTTPIVELLGHLTVDLSNQSSIVGEAEKYTHFGNYLQLSGNAQPLAITNGGLITAATYGNPNTGGRVLVSSSNYWMDNFGINGGYIGAGLNNRILAENTIDWLDQDSRVIKTAQDISSSTISGSFVVFENNSIATTTPNLYIEGNNLVTYESIIPINHGNGTYSFSYSLNGQGIFRVIAALGTDYVVWEKVIDNLGPTISVLDGNKPNGSSYEDANFYNFEFIVTDDISGVNSFSIIVKLDNAFIDPVVDYNEVTTILSIIVRDDEIQINDPKEFHQLEITVPDKNGNKSKYTYYFQIGDQVIDTNTITSTSLPTSSSGDNNVIFDNLDIVIISILGLIILALSYKNYNLKKSN